jgi:hypothetical protein
VREASVGPGRGGVQGPAEGSRWVARGAILLRVRRARARCSAAGGTTAVFVVDDLVSWLIGRLADAGYQKLNTRLHGGERGGVVKALEPGDPPRVGKYQLLKARADSQAIGAAGGPAGGCSMRVGPAYAW